MKYKVGDKVKVTRCETGHEFEIGETIEILGIEEGTMAEYYAQSIKRPDEDWHVTKNEIEPLTPSKEELEKFWNDEDTTDYSKPTKGEIHRRLCEELNNTYVRKNYDYGDSYGQLRGRYPDSILIRLYDKFSRLERLIGGRKAKVEDESVEDTLLDLANYALMEVVERRSEKK